MSVSEDAWLGGRLRLRQFRRGYRAGMDAALLAAACDAPAGARVIEAGCGVAGVLLSAAIRRPEAHFLGIERDAEALDLANQNISLNALTDRVSARAGDVELGFRVLGLQPFDAAMSNPPFFDDAGALRGPATEKAGAWMADGGLGAWVGFLLKAVREGGTITLIHRADRLGDILGLLAPKAGSVRIRPVQPFGHEPAKRVIVRAIKTGRAPMVLLPPLVLHDASGDKHTPQAEAILRGETALAWV